MKVIAFNGSPNAQGNTYACLQAVAKPLTDSGIEVEIVHIGSERIAGCIACRACKQANRECAIDDIVNACIQKAAQADGILLGAPVYYGGVNGTMKSFLDRLFYVSAANGGLFQHKVGAAVTAVRRSGGLTTFNELNHYLLSSGMVIPTSNYWNIVHGHKPGEALRDTEGMQCMDVLGRNMAWLMRIIEAGKTSLPAPEAPAKVYMHFIR